MHPLACLAFFCLAILGACASPGPSFAVVTRQALSGDRKAALHAGFGISLSFSLQALFCLWGVQWVMEKYPHAMNMIRLLGSFYLFYLGTQTLRESRQDLKLTTIAPSKTPFLAGLIVTMLNPQAILFLVSLFQDFIQSSMEVGMRLSFVATTGVCSLAWYSFLSWILTYPSLFQRFRSFQSSLLLFTGLFLWTLGSFMFFKACSEGFF